MTLPPLVQGNGIRDYVFPIAEIEADTDGVRFTRFRGTGFFIGSRNFALTARHVIEDVKSAGLGVMLVDADQSWRVFEVVESEIHPDADIALLRIGTSFAAQSWNSIVSGRTVPSPFGALPYHLWGYPEEALYELVTDEGGLLRPDLIYSEGHVRRRLRNVPIPKIQGASFVELSQVAGSGCSGSPVFSKLPRSMWALAGVYVGERTNDRSTSVGYAVPIDAFAEWTPEPLGRTVAEELADGKPVE